MLQLLILMIFTHSGAHAQYDYATALSNSIEFYEAQQSGPLSLDNHVPWRYDAAMTDTVLKGWFDAGDHVKFGFPMAWSTSTLIWGLLEFPEAYAKAGQTEHALLQVKYTLDYFLGCHIAQNVFVGQIGDGHADHAYWGRPEDMTMPRPAFYLNTTHPGSDLVGETVAALAGGFLLLRDSTDSMELEYAVQCLSSAEALYDFAYNYQGIYSQSIPNAGSFYSSSGFRDELAWGAAWLYWATNDQTYKNRALEFYHDGPAWAYSWDNKDAGVQMLMYKLTGEEQYKGHVERFLDTWYPGGQLPYTPKGLAYRDAWGALRYSANTAFISLVADKYNIKSPEARNWAKGQIDYMLGSTGRSYVCGFGVNPPLQPHHRAASCPWPPEQCDWNTYNSPGPNAHVLTGALVGGPDSNDQYVDSRQDYQKNEVATDYNAGFQGALAGIVHFFT